MDPATLWAGAVGGVVGFADSLFYTGEEQAADEIARSQVNLGYESLATQERIARQDARSDLIASGQESSRTRTLVVGGVAAVGMVAVVWAVR